MYLIGQLWFYLLCSAGLGVLIGLTTRKLYRAVRLQHTLEAVEFRHTEQMASVSADHEAALVALDQLRAEFKRVQEQGGSTHDLQTRIDLREQQLKDLGNQLRRVNQELMRNQVTQQQLALERKQAATEIDTLKVQVASSRARLAQAVSQHEEEKAALLRQLVALMPAAGLTAASDAAAAKAAAPAVPGTFAAAAALAGANLAPAVARAAVAEPLAAAAPAAPAAEVAVDALVDARRTSGADDDAADSSFADTVIPTVSGVEVGPQSSREGGSRVASEGDAAPMHGHASGAARHGQGIDPGAEPEVHVMPGSAASDAGLQSAVQAGIAAAMASMASGAQPAAQH
ncbi:MAG: hypothetical protein RIQ60_2627 [Pseudomonadota bacterium]|jgi:membrane protein involved in colicin uptake